MTLSVDIPKSPSCRPLRVAVVGAGAIGLYYGVKLAEAGSDVHFLMRAGFEEAKSSGIYIKSHLGDSHLRNPQVSRTTEEIGPVDCVLIAVKTTSNKTLRLLLPPLLKNSTTVVTLQNGLGNEEFLSQFLAPSQVLGGVCFVSLTRTSPASVDHQGSNTIQIGEFSQGIISSRIETLTTLWQKAGVEAKGVTSIMNVRWQKLLWNIPFNGLSVVAGGITVDQLLHNPKFLSEIKELMNEILAAANALGFPIDAEYTEYQLKRSYNIGTTFRPSTAVDFLAGRELEIEAIWGIPLRQAKSAGLEMPHLSLLYERLCQLNPAPSKTL